MATENLTVKFKVDTSEVKQGADEAKNKVKSAAQSMSSDVRQASSSMKSSLGDVQNAAQGIERATKSASNAVGQMERQVSQSASRMSGELGKVAEQIKGISTRQMIGFASRGLNAGAQAMGWFANNVAEEGSETQAALKVGQGALAGAASGAMLGGTLGTIVPGIGNAVGAAIGGAVGALAGAASELWEASSALKKSAEERQQAAQKTLQQAGNELRERDKVAGWDKENQVLLSGIGKTWWQSKDGTRSITGEQRVFKIQEARQAELDKAVKQRDEFVRAHQNDTGEEAARSAITFNLLEKAVQEAAQHLQALAPVVDAAKKSEADKVKEQQKQQEAYAKASAALDAKVAKVVEEGRKAEISETKDSIGEHQYTMSSLQSQLQGVISSPLVGNLKVDSLTRIGGGRGYAAYNNSAANVQAKIENHLKELIKIEQTQLTELNTKLENLTTVVQNKGSTAEWAS